MIVVIFAHPYPRRSRANRALLSTVGSLSEVSVRSLYDLYPDFDVDVQAEQAALLSSQIVVWQHPMYWYSVPGLLKHWFDKVLARGWAYGEGGAALRGKRCLWVVTTGGDDSAFRTEGMHGHELEAFIPHVAQTARFCGMRWEPPLVVQGAPRLAEPALSQAADTYRARLQELVSDARKEQHG